MKTSKLMTRFLNQTPLLRSVFQDKSGIAAIEFAFVAPILIAFYFGMTEIAMAITADRQVAHATSVAGDLATQLPSMSSAELSDVMTATVAVLGTRPGNVNDVAIELNSYQKMSDGTDNLVGYASTTTKIPGAAFDPKTLNNLMYNEQSGVVVARISYSYTPATMMFLNRLRLSETFVLKPRQSISVPFDESGKTEFSCTVGSDLRVSCI